MPQPQPALRTPLVGDAQGAPTGEKRIIVRIVSYRCRLCDPDNNVGGCKALIDQLRYANLIPNDRPQDIKLESEQVKVGHKSEEKTTVEITYA